MLTSALKKLLALSLIVCLNIGSAWSQCESWAGNPNEEELTEFYVLVTDFIKAKDYDNAFEYWQKLYAECPAADGKRKGVFTSGRTIYLDKFSKETDATKKKEYADMIEKLYTQEMECFGNEGYLYGRMAYDMFYSLRTPYSTLLETLDKSLEAGGNNSEYIIFA